MKLFLFICCLGSTQAVFAWGFYGHGKINEIAVYTLPKPLFGFYKKHVDYIFSHAADADKRRYALAEEACRHYLDGDHYELCLPLDTLPKNYKDACSKYTEDTVLAHGIVPWHISVMMFRLTEAFKSADVERILKLSADLGHYVGDLHVPLHATSNYNGQKSGQKGIHGLWESRLPELYFENYNMFTGLASYCQNSKDSIWEAYEQSFGLVDSVLATEKKVSEDFSDDLKYSWEARGNTSVRVYSREFCLAYHLALGNMVENRLRASVKLLGSLWYTCWVDAGQPDLENMPVPEVLPSETIPTNSKMIGREED